MTFIKNFHYPDADVLHSASISRNPSTVGTTGRIRHSSESRLWLQPVAADAELRQRQTRRDDAAVDGNGEGTPAITLNF